jgi:hypothetical protein
MHLIEIMYQDANCIELHRDRLQWRAVVNMGSIRAGEIFG